MVFLEFRLVDHVYLFSDAILRDSSTTVRLLTSKNQVKACGQVLAPVALKELILLSSHCSDTTLSVATICSIISWKIRRITGSRKVFFPDTMNNRIKQLYYLYYFKMDLCTRLFYLCIPEKYRGMVGRVKIMHFSSLPDKLIWWWRLLWMDQVSISICGKVW